MQTEFCTTEELAQFTGYRQTKRQIEFLRKTVPIVGINRLGQPLVLYESIFGKPRNSEKSPVKTTIWQPPNIHF